MKLIRILEVTHAAWQKISAVFTEIQKFSLIFSTSGKTFYACLSLRQIV